MGHLVFIVLHFLAFMCGFFGLFITIPLHVIYSAMPNNSGAMVVKTSEPQNIGRLIGLCIRVLLIFFAGLVMFGLFLRIYSKMYGRSPWH